MSDNLVEDREPKENSQHDLNDNLVNQALALTEDRSNRNDASSKPGSSSQLPPGLDNFCISMMPKENTGSSNLPKLSIDQPQLPEQKPGEQPLDRPTGPQPGAPELWDKPAQTEFDTISGAAGNSTDTSVHPAEKQVTAPTEKAPAEDTPVGGSAKGGGEYQLCAAENPGGSGLPLERVNQANDAATATNIATAGRRANNPFFNPSSGALGLVTDFDVSPLTVAGWVSDAWSRLGAINDALSGARPADFHPINGPNGRPAVVAMSTSRWTSNPTISLGLNGRNESIKMDLPNFSGSAVTLVTDGHRVLAIDPRNNQAWQLQQDFIFGIRNGFSWTELPRRR